MKRFSLLLLSAMLLLATACTTTPREESAKTGEDLETGQKEVEFALKTDTTELRPDADRTSIQSYAEYLSQFEALEYPLIVESSYRSTEMDRISLTRDEYIVGYLPTKGKFRALITFYPAGEYERYTALKTYDLEGEPVDLLQVAYYIYEHDIHEAAADIDEDGQIVIIDKVQEGESEVQSATRTYQLQEDGEIVFVKGDTSLKAPNVVFTTAE